MTFPLLRLTCAAILLFSCAPLLQAQLRISEFMASNTGTLADEDGDFEDWIEIQNTSVATVNLLDWSLTDDSGDLMKWRFPATNLPPGGFLVVFASNKDRDKSGSPLHTNFRLGTDGEYLALVNPGGVVVSQFSPKFPAQVPDVSFGYALAASNVTFVASNAAARVLVPTVGNGGSTLNYSWIGLTNHEPFNTTSWTGGSLGVGFGVSGVGLNLQSAMLNNNASAFLRVPFVVDNPTNYSLLMLRLGYDDGYVAWLNGVPLGRMNAPEEDLDWNSTAVATHSAGAFETSVYSAASSLLVPGTNILAIQGLNIAANNGSFLIQPELTAITVASENSGVYFTSPTPGAANIGGTTIPGPGIANVTHAPQLPSDSDNLTVTARVFPTAHPVANVRLYYRIMYGSEVMLAMFDDGAHGDGASGDGIYGASIPANVSSSGQMVRYYITAEDTGGTTSRLPLFTDPAGTAEYFGAVIDPNSVSSKVPVFHLFIDPANQSAADSQSGSRCSFYYDGEFYDNIGINLRGNTTGGYAKKSHRLEFNREHKLRHPGQAERIRDTSLMAEFIDPMYLRHYLSFWLLEQAGHTAPFHYPVRVQNNGAFYQFAYHQEVLGNEQLERFGFDPEGSLYKAVGTLNTSPCSTGGGPEPKTAAAQSMADYYELANAINASLSTAQRRTNVFDILDLPDVINYMACTRLTHEDDDTWANMSVYRDTFGDQLWRIIPFDLNLSWGQTYANSTVQATNDSYRSHPFWGSSPVFTGGACGFNHLYDAIVAIPETRAMLLRRTRSVMDQFLEPPGTPATASVLMQHISSMTNLIWSEAFLDRATWGWPPNFAGPYAWGLDQYLTNGVTTFVSQYLEPRRRHLYITHCATNTAKPIGLSTSSNAGIPTSQSSNLVIAISGFEYNPASGNQDEEYVQLTNANGVAVDISNWKLEGGIRFQFKPGTVMPANSVLYVSPDVRAFRSRTTGPRGGQGLFVVGPYAGRLNAWGEALTLMDSAQRLVASNGFAGNPSPAQRYLRITEIMYNPSPAPSITNDPQQFEYVELKNISTSETLNLTGVRFTNGIAFNFTGAAISTLNPGQTVLLVRNQAAFIARYGSGYNIAGVFAGALDNGGENLRLEDAVGEKILEFNYNDSWYPITDGLGFSLVILDENAHWSAWDKKSGWRASGNLNGSPGAADPDPQPFSPVLVNEVLTHTDLPQLDSIELFNPNASAVNIGGWYLTDDFYTPKKYRIPTGTTIPANGYLTFTENQFNTGAEAFRFSELGEDVYLFSANSSSNLNGYFHGYDFGEAPNGVSFGRYANSQTNVHFVLQSAVTLGTSNAYPRVGPVVISEIMFHPPDTNGADNALDEFIELQNIVATNVPLYDVAAITNTWRLRNAVDFDFPPNQTLAAGARCLVVGFDPTNTLQLAAFRSRYGVSNNIAVYGPWSGKLDNSSETIELKRPGPIDDTLIVPFYLTDKIAYDDNAPWPAGADGIGNSLQRVSVTGYGNDPTNWFAAGITAGRASVLNIAPIVDIASPTNGAVLLTTNGIVVSVTAGDPGGVLALVQLFGNGIELGRWTAASSNFVWAGVPVGAHILYARATDNLGAVAESDEVVVNVTAPPPTVAIVSPASGAVLQTGSAVTLSATATSAGGPASLVSFYLDGTLLTSVEPPFTTTWNVAGPGDHLLSAIAFDAANQASEPASIPVFVQAASLNPVLIPMGASGWKYLDNGLNPGTAWTNLSFNDASWSNGVAELGFGDGDEQTVIRRTNPGGSNTIAFFFRKRFVVPSLTGITNVELNVIRDDGAIAYVNGREVFRNNMPDGDVTHVTRASSGIVGNDERIPVSTSFSPSILVPGTNLLAIRLHQNQNNSSDLSMDLSLTLQGLWLGPAFAVQPTNQVVNEGSPVTFSASAAGSQPISYGWHFNDAPLPTFTNVLQLPIADAQDAGSYFVVASNFLNVATSRVATLTIVISDTDGDGMPDVWENANGTNPAVDDRHADLDLDGHGNFQEYLAGTSPTNAASVLKIEHTQVSGNNVILNFTAVSNRTYSVQQRSGIATGSWLNWQDVPSAPSNRPVWLTNTLAGSNTLYRLVTPMQ